MQNDSNLDPETAAAYAALNQLRLQDQARVMLRNAYTSMAGQTRNAARGCDDKTYAAVGAFLNNLDAVVMAGDTLRQVIPYPRIVGEYLPQFVYSADMINAGLQAQREMSGNGLQAARAAMPSILAGVFNAAIPPMPDNASEDAIADRKRDLTRVLDGASTPSATAQQIIRQAVADGDMLTLAVLLGKSMSFDLTYRQGVDRQTLQRVAAEAQAAQFPADSKPFMGGVAGIDFIRLQSTGNATLADVANAAEAYYNARLAEATAILKSVPVRQAMTS